MTTAEQIKKARKKKGWTQVELAEEVRCTEKTISRIETGQPCSTDILTSIAKALGLERNELVDSAESPAVRRRPVRRVRDGFACIETLFEMEHTLTIVRVERDPKDDEIHDAICAVCDSIDAIRTHKTRYLVPTRTLYDAARAIGESVKRIEKRGWLLELRELQEEVYGRDYDYICFWEFNFRPAEPEEIGTD